MTFVFIDRVLELDRSRRILAARQLTAAEDIFQQHFPGNPMLPASLVQEAFAQAATILLEASCGFERKAYVGYVEKAKFRRPVRPGYEMIVELEIEHGGIDGALVRGQVTQREQKCATIGMGMVTAPMGEFFQPHQIGYYQDLYRRMLAETTLKGFDRHPLEAWNHV